MVQAIARSTVVALSLVIALSASALAAGQAYTTTYQRHSEFFTAETHQPSPVDPEVFVADAATPAGKAFFDIAHAAGYRPAKPGADPGNSALYTAQGKPLGFTLDAWLAAAGQGSITCDGGAAVAALQFNGLIPGGFYQVVRYPPNAPGAPLGKTDGSDSTFIAAKDGTASYKNTLPFCPDPNEITALDYHSDGAAHGASLGDTGINAFDQLAGTYQAAPKALPNTGAGGSDSTTRALFTGIIILACAGAGLRVAKVRA